LFYAVEKLNSTFSGAKEQHNASPRIITQSESRCQVVYHKHTKELRKADRENGVSKEVE